MPNCTLNVMNKSFYSQPNLPVTHISLVTFPLALKLKLNLLNKNKLFYHTKLNTFEELLMTHYATCMILKKYFY